MLLKITTNVEWSVCSLKGDLTDPSSFMCAFGWKASPALRKKGKGHTKNVLRLQHISGFLELLSKERVINA